MTACPRTFRIAADTFFSTEPTAYRCTQNHDAMQTTSIIEATMLNCVFRFMREGSHKLVVKASFQDNRVWLCLAPNNLERCDEKRILAGTCHSLPMSTVNRCSLETIERPDMKECFGKCGLFMVFKKSELQRFDQNPNGPIHVA